MTTTPPENKGATTVPINLSKWFDNAKAQAYLADIFSAWERGRKAVDSSGNIPSEEWSYIVRRTVEFSASIAAATLDEAGGQIATHGAKAIAATAFSDGYAKGRAAVKLPGKLAESSPKLDSDAILKTIGEELRKMFDAGLQRGKEAAAGTGEAGKLEKPSGEIVRVQRNAAGEIIGAVKEFTYPVAPGGV